MIEEDEELGGFETPINFGMPDFSAIGKTMKMLSWLPAIITCVTMTTLTFLALVMYNGLVQSDYNLTYGAFMMLVLVSFAVGMISGGLVKIATSMKQKNSVF